MLAVAAAVGVVVGLAVGALGAGGSVLGVPALVYLLDVPVRQAVPLSLVVVGAASAAGLVPRLRHGQVRGRLGLAFAVAGAPAAVGGAALSRALDPRVVLGVLAVLLVVAAVRLAVGEVEGGRGAGAAPASGPGRVAVVVVAGLVVGLLTGLVGVGGGFLVVPVLVAALGLPLREAVATSLLVVTLNAVVGLAAHAQDVSLPPGLTAVFGATAVATALLGERASARVGQRPLSLVFAAALVGVGVLVGLSAAGVVALPQQPR